MVNAYENVPVFRSGTRQDHVDSIIGKATVKIDEENERSTITIEAGKVLTDFFLMGKLRAFDLSASISDVDTEKAKEYWSRQQQ